MHVNVATMLLITLLLSFTSHLITRNDYYVAVYDVSNDSSSTSPAISRWGSSSVSRLSSPMTGTIKSLSLFDNLPIDLQELL